MELPIAVVFMPFPRFVVPTSDPPLIAAPKPAALCRRCLRSCVNSPMVAMRLRCS